MAKGKRLFLIDGMSQIYRAYYAIRNLSNSKGLPTNAVFGFTAMLRKLIQDEKPDYVGVAMDLEGPTVRHEQYESYKATRKPMPEDLVTQIPYILKVCEAFRVPVIGFQGYEADDVIGTLSRLAVEQGLTAIIVTGDKDMLQLVSDDVLVLDPRKENLLIDRDGVRERLGVRPDQVPDLLGLWGDASDNIPGAPGIGEKGARDLIQAYGTLDECLAQWQQVKRKTYQESLRDNVDLIRLSRELATIRRDLPISLGLAALQLSEPDGQAAFELFSELEFKSLMREFLAEGTGTGHSAPLLSGENAREHLSSLGRQERFYFALETVNLPLGRRGATHLVVKGDSGPGAVTDLAEAGIGGTILASADGPRKICWDAKAAMLALDFRRLRLAPPLDDVMMMAFLTAPQVGDYSLRRWALEQAQMDVPQPSAPSTEMLPGTEAGTAAECLLKQTEAIARLHQILSARLDEMGLRPVYEEIELPLVEVLADMERTGVKVDRRVLASMADAMEVESAQLTRDIYAEAGVEFNINSTKQLGEILFERLNLPTMKRTRKTRGHSTDQSVLEELAATYPIARLVLAYRQVSKLKSTYVDALPGLIHPETGRVHTSYNQTGAATGRISSSDPNLQNIPVRTDEGRRIREAFVPERGNVLVSADYSQVELRVLAHLSGDPGLVEAFRNAEDIHARTAAEVFGSMAAENPAEYRRRAKAINFGIIYGLSAFGLARQLGISREEAQMFIDAYFARYRGVRSWLDKTLEEARKTGVVRTMFGRQRPVPDLQSKDFNKRNFAERIAVNSPIQGTAADIIKIAMVRLHETFKEGGLSARILMQVHDELVFELPSTEAEAVVGLARACMEQAAVLNVPLVVDIHVGDNWKDLK